MAYIIAAIIILIIILILIGILVVPFQISLRLYRMGSVNEGHFKLSWARIGLIHRKFPSKKKEPKKEKKKKEIDFSRVPKIISLFIESLPYIFNIFEAFLKSISVNKVSIDSVIGLTNSADTAIITGYLWALSSIINIIPNTCLTVEPDFNKERIDGSFLIELKLILLWIAIEGLKALTKKPVRSLLFELRKVRG